MAYGLKYSMQVAAKSQPTELIYTLEIYKKDFVSDEEVFEAAEDPIIVQVLANSDDPFEPIVPTQLTVLADITDFGGQLPDFTSRDDRLYWGKLYAQSGTFLVWQGFVLQDNTNVPFTTGFIALQLIFVDGLAILNSIPYEPTDPDINVLEDLSTVITNCLNKIGLPDGYNINYLANIYGSVMDTNISVFKQCYYAPRNWLNNDLTFKTCFEVLEIICKAFGAQIFQSNGEWWVANVNDRATEFITFFQTDQDNGAEAKISRGKMREILPYDLSDTDNSPWHFEEGIQTKILRKGYASIEFTHNVGFAPQGIDNGTLEDTDGASYYRNWGKSVTASVTATTLGPYPAILLQPTGGGPTQRLARAFPLSSAPGNQGDQINLSFLIDGQATPSPTVPKCWLQILVQDPITLDIYWLDSSNNWVLQVGAAPVPDDRYYPVMGTTSSTYESVGVTTPPLPISGNLFFQWATDNFDTLVCTIANAVMTFTNQYSAQKITAEVSGEDNYKKSADFILGSDVFANPVEIGALLDVGGNPIIQWYRLGTVPLFTSVMRILIQQYVNVVSKAQINFSMTASGLLDDRVDGFNRRSHIVGLIDTVTVEDNTGTTISVDGKYYITGVMSYNYVEDNMNGTLLETSNVDLEVDITDTLITKK